MPVGMRGKPLLRSSGRTELFTTESCTPRNRLRPPSSTPGSNTCATSIVKVCDHDSPYHGRSGVVLGADQQARWALCSPRRNAVHVMFDTLETAELSSRCLRPTCSAVLNAERSEPKIRFPQSSTDDGCRRDRSYAHKHPSSALTFYHGHENQNLSVNGWRDLWRSMDGGLTSRRGKRRDSVRVFV